MYLSKSQSRPRDEASGVDKTALGMQNTQTRRHRRAFSLSTEPCDQSRTRDFIDRIQPTFEWQMKGYKGNTRGGHIHEPFVTLERVLVKIPEQVPINIDISVYCPCPCNTQFMHMTNPSPPLQNITCYGKPPNGKWTHGPSSSIPFSTASSPPFINSQVPVSSSSPPSHPRSASHYASSKDAVHFARRWALDGIVEASAPMVHCPALVRHAKSHDLICASWGPFNNDPASAFVSINGRPPVSLSDSATLLPFSKLHPVTLVHCHVFSPKSPFRSKPTRVWMSSSPTTSIRSPRRSPGDTPTTTDHPIQSSSPACVDAVATPHSNEEPQELLSA